VREMRSRCREIEGLPQGVFFGQKSAIWGRFRSIFARFFAFFRRDFREIMLIVKELIELCTKRSAPFFAFKAKNRAKRANI